MSRDNDRFIVMPPGLDGTATVTADVTRYFVAPRAIQLRELYSWTNGAIDFTSGDEQARVLIDYATTIGGAYTSVHTESLANANTWTNGTPKAHTVTDAEKLVRIPAGSIVRITFDVNGTTPSFANLYVQAAFQPL